MPTNEELKLALRALADKLPPYEYAEELNHVIRASATQQARIDALTAGLTDAESLLYHANQTLGSLWAYMLNHGEFTGAQVRILIDACEKWNVEYAGRKSYEALYAAAQDGE